MNSSQLTRDVEKALPKQFVAWHVYFPKDV